MVPTATASDVMTVGANPARCSQGSTTTRSTTRDASPSRCGSVRTSPQRAMVSKWIDGCLALFPRAAWDELAAKASALPVTSEGARIFQRFLFGAAFEIELDRQGRLVVPAVLRQFAGLGVGRRDRGLARSPRALVTQPHGAPSARGWTSPSCSPSTSRDWASEPYEPPGSGRTVGAIASERNGSRAPARDGRGGHGGSLAPTGQLPDRCDRRRRRARRPDPGGRQPRRAAARASTRTRARSSGRAHRLAEHGDRVTLRQANFEAIGEVAREAGFDARRRHPPGPRPQLPPARPR